MQYILLIAVFLALGVLTKKAADIVKNLLYIALLLLAGAFVWYILVPYFYGTKLENIYKKEAQKQQQQFVEVADATRKNAQSNLSLNDAIKQSILQKKVQLTDQFVQVANNKMIEIKNQYAQKLSTVEMPKMPSVDMFVKMNSTQKATIKNSVVDFFKSVPTKEVVDAPIEDIAPEGEPDVIMQGLFTDELALDTAQGLVTVYRLESGVVMLRLEQFSISNGPDQQLYLAQIDPTGEDVSDTFVFVGLLKGNAGDQNYLLPADIQVELFDVLVVYSPTLDTAYAVTPLR